MSGIFCFRSIRAVHVRYFPFSLYPCSTCQVFSVLALYPCSTCEVFSVFALSVQYMWGIFCFRSIGAVHVRYFLFSLYRCSTCEVFTVFALSVKYMWGIFCFHSIYAVHVRYFQFSLYPCGTCEVFSVFALSVRYMWGVFSLQVPTLEHRGLFRRREAGLQQDVWRVRRPQAGRAEHAQPTAGRVRQCRPAGREGRPLHQGGGQWPGSVRRGSTGS